MDTMTVLVSFKVDDNQRNIIENGLIDLCRVVYLTEVQNRNEAIQNADVIFSWNPTREFADEEYGLMQNTKLMQLLSAGADHLPAAAFKQNFVVAGNVGAYAEPMAEHVVAMVLALAKDLRGGTEKLREGIFDQMSLNKFVKGSTCAILGFGGIGKATAKLMRAFGAHIWAINTSGKTDEPVDFVGTLKDLDYVLSNADIVVISLPLSKSTRGIIGKRELELMKPDAILVNVARGEIIDEQALYEHLKSHPQFKAGIDAWWVEPFRHGKFEMHYPFLELPNVVGTPHNSGSVPGQIWKATEYAVENIRTFLTGGRAKGILNPEEYA
jgi:glycerate dehydrogenase